MIKIIAIIALTAFIAYVVAWGYTWCVMKSFELPDEGEQIDG